MLHPLCQNHALELQVWFNHTHLALLGVLDGLLHLLANAVTQLLHGLAQQLRQAGSNGGQPELVLGAGLGAALGNQPREINWAGWWLLSKAVWCEE